MRAEIPQLSLDSLQSILRVSPEPQGFITEAVVHRLLCEQPADYLAFMQASLDDIANGRMQVDLPPKQLFSDPDPGGDFRVMPCVTRTGDRVTKTVKLVGTNLHQQRIPDQITVGRAFALDPHENFVSHTFEACLLSSARTGLCAALARRLLSQGRELNSLGIIGAGRVGWYAAYFSCADRPPECLRISDCNTDRADIMAAQLQTLYPQTDIRATSAAEARAVDTVILATTTREPLLDPQTTRATLIVSLGADTDDQSELTDDWANVAQVYVDTADTLRFGDLQRWVRRGLLKPCEVTDLTALLRDDSLRRSSGRPKLFVSTGSALFDNLTIAYLLDRLRSD